MCYNYCKDIEILELCLMLVQAIALLSHCEPATLNGVMTIVQILERTKQMCYAMFD